VPGRTKEKLDALEKVLGEEVWKGVIPVSGEVSDEKSAASLKEAVILALPTGKKLSHVVASIGSITTSASSPTQTSLEDLHKQMQVGWNEHFLAARTFLPLLKEAEGSYTVVNGGLGEIVPPVAALWPTTLKCAALNGLYLALAGETKDQKVRVNQITIAVLIVADGKETKADAPGRPSYSTNRLAPVFASVAATKVKGQLIRLLTAESFETTAKDLDAK